MAKEKDKKTLPTDSKKVYTNLELDNLWQEIVLYRQEQTLETGEVVKPINWPRFYESKGVCRVRVIDQTREEMQTIEKEVEVEDPVNGKWVKRKVTVKEKKLVTVKTGVKIEVMSILRDDFSDEIPYLAVENMVNQCMERRARVQYGERRRLADLSKLEASMKIEI